MQTARRYDPTQDARGLSGAGEAPGGGEVMQNSKTISVGGVPIGLSPVFKNRGTVPRIGVALACRGWTGTCNAYDVRARGSVRRTVPSAPRGLSGPGEAPGGGEVMANSKAIQAGDAAIGLSPVFESAGRFRALGWAFACRGWLGMCDAYDVRARGPVRRTVPSGAFFRYAVCAPGMMK
jgi:hypothetical protein